MPQLRIVARFADGSMLKGHTDNFNPNAPTFNLHPVAMTTADRTGAIVRFDELKAVFMVKDFLGKPPTDENESEASTGTEAETKLGTESDATSEPNPAPPVAVVGGLVFRVTFKDGEELVGSTMTYDPAGTGFFLFPLDSESNNERVFVVNAFVDKVERVDMAKAG